MQILTTPERYALYKNHYVTGRETLVYRYISQWAYCWEANEVEIKAIYFPHWNDHSKLLITSSTYYSMYPPFNDFITTKGEVYQVLLLALNATEKPPRDKRKIRDFATWAKSDWNKRRYDIERIFYDAEKNACVYKCIRYNTDGTEEVFAHNELPNFNDLYKSWLNLSVAKDYPDATSNARTTGPKSLYAASTWALNGNGGRLSYIVPKYHD